VNKILIITLFISALNMRANADDLSSLNIVANTASTSAYVQLLITDPMGRQTGIPTVGSPNIQNIPGSSYFPESFGNEETGEAGTEIVRFGINPVIPGSYTIVLIGLAKHSYSMSMEGNDSSGNSANYPATAFTGYLDVGTSQQFVLPINTTPGASISITKTVTFDALSQELEVAFQLNEIGGKRFVDGLADLLTQAQKALGHKDGDDRDHHHDGDDQRGNGTAVEKLREFITRIDRAAKDKPDGDQDRDDKRFASSTAAQSLISDAKTLIKPLGDRSDRDHDEQHKHDH
jgi:hypothetical protein